MRTFHIFKIKNEYAVLMKNNSYQLFRLLDFIYNLDKKEVCKGAELFYKVVDDFNSKKFDIHIFKKYQENYFYTKFQNIHQINNIYKKEQSKLTVKKHYLLLESTIVNPTFLDDLKEFNNLFLCDFENKDYFWLEKILV